MRLLGDEGGGREQRQWLGGAAAGADEDEEDDGEPVRPGSIPWMRTMRAARRIFSLASIYSAEILTAAMHGDGGSSMAACGELGLGFPLGKNG